MSILHRVRQVVASLVHNELITPADLFSCGGSRSTIYDILSDMVEDGILVRFAAGVYGIVGSQPTVFEIATVKAKRYKRVIAPKSSDHKDAVQQHIFLSDGRTTSFRLNARSIGEKVVFQERDRATSRKAKSRSTVDSVETGSPHRRRERVRREVTCSDDSTTRPSTKCQLGGVQQSLVSTLPAELISLLLRLLDTLVSDPGVPASATSSMTSLPNTVLSISSARGSVRLRLVCTRPP